MIDVQAPFLPHFFQVARAERVPHVPAHAQHNDVSFAHDAI